KLFNPEEFVTTKGTNNESGTGLGLNLVSEFVTLNKGTIEIKSQVNVGTTFYLTFPKPMPEIENSVISS
ncbi:MAG: ATP-binding protein, partial [Bacteroidales bacterium]